MNDLQIQQRKSQIELQLARLATMPGSLAAHLLDLGIEGEQDRCDGCPISQYLIATGCGVVLVEATVVAFLDIDNDAWHEVPMPWRLTEFVGKFNQGVYPWLIKDWMNPGKVSAGSVNGLPVTAATGAASINLR